jgi:hypothetical protein
MLHDVIAALLVLVMVPVGTILTVRAIGKKKRIRRPLPNFR